MLVATSPRRNRVLEGMGVSAGCARGTAQLARSLDDARSIGRGAVLVAESLPAGWVPMLGEAAGVVVGTGALLCNAAIVLRELGIPAVMGVGPAIDAIRLGEALELDGCAGTVELENGAM